MIPLKAVIFDYGNVLCEPQQLEDLDAMAGVLQITRERFDDFYWRKRLSYDRSELTLREYWDDFCNMAGISLLNEANLERVALYDGRSWSHVNEKMVAWAGQLRASGLKTAVLSNMPLPLREYLDTQYAWLHNFDHRVFSCDVRLAKPDPEIYRLSLAGLGVAPEEALFLDDRPDNITAARKLGIHGLLFTNAADAVAELDGRYDLAPLVV